MPAMGGQGGKYVPPPKPSNPVGAAIQSGAAAGARSVARSPGTDVGSGGSYTGYGGAKVDAYKASPAYHQAIVAVFNHQPTVQRAAIIRGLQSQPNAFNTPVGRAVRDALSGLSMSAKMDLAQHLPQNSFLSQAGGFLEKGVKYLEGLHGHVGGGLSGIPNVGSNATGSVASSGPAEAALKTVAGGGAQLIDKFGRLHVGPQDSGANIAQEASGLGAGQIGRNAFKDAINLPAELLPSAAIPIGQALSNHWGQAANSVLGPYKQLVQHPGQMIQNHPLDSFLLAAGPVHAVTRFADQGYRAVTGNPADLRSPSIHLTGNLTKERPNKSKYPLIRHGQNVVERVTYQHAGTPKVKASRALLDKSSYGKPKDGLVPRSENRRNMDIRVGTSQRVGMNERIRRYEVQAQEHAHTQAVLASRSARVAQGVKNVPKYNPPPTLIRGAGVLAHINEGVFRRPDTYIADLTKRIGKVEAARSDLLDFPKALAEHDAYVKGLKAELARAQKDKNLQQNLAPAFRASESHGQAYGPLEKQAHAFNHYGKDVSLEDLRRRVLTPIVDAHMPGARFDKTLQTMVRDGQKAASDAAVARLRAKAATLEKQLQHQASGGVDSPALKAIYDQIQALRAKKSAPISTAEMQKFADQQTGGRTLSYSSHQAPKGDSAFYVSGQKFPSKSVQRNTMYAFHHGLTDPSHEALLGSRVHLQGVISAHESMGRLLGTLTEKNKDGNYWDSFTHAKNDAPPGYQPIYVGPIHGYAQDVSPNDAASAVSLEEEAQKHSLDLNARLHDGSQQGNWAVIHKSAVDQLRIHEGQISPNILWRGFRGTTNQFRKVALGLSMKHIPGVVQESLIRDAASGVFVQHWLAERNVYKEAAKIDPKLAEQRRIELGGGTVSGNALSLMTRRTAAHYDGTIAHPFLTSFDKLMRAPVARHLSAVWNGWLHLALNGTKHVLEVQHQRAAVGKQLLNEFGGMLRLQGEAAKIAAEKGYLPDVEMRRLRAGQERMFGHWTDQTPQAQLALAVSPFGMWWVNSARWLGRLPVDHPLGTSLLASENMGTEKERIKLGLDMFAPGHLPLYKQGAAALGGGLLSQANYYSPAGIMNDPLVTAGSLVLPTVQPILDSLRGINWLGKAISSPGYPHGGGPNPVLRNLIVLGNSIVGMLVPLYQKLQTVAQGGGSAYDTSTLVSPQTKGQNPGIVAGLEKAFSPFKLTQVGAPSAASHSGGSGGGRFGGGSSSGGSSSSGSSSGRFGGGSSSSSSGGSGRFG